MQVSLLLAFLFLTSTSFASADQCGALLIGGTNPINPASSNVMSGFGLHFLKHQTDISNLVGIFQAGALLPASERAGPRTLGQFTKVFFDVLKDSKIPPAEDIPAYSGSVSLGADPKNWYGDLTAATLVVSTRLLDTRSFAISSRGWAYGEIDPRTDYISEHGPAKLSAFLTKERPGEVMVTGSVSLSEVKEIWVHPVMRETVLTALRNHNIFEVGGRPIESIIVSPATDKKFIPFLPSKFVPPQDQHVHYILDSP